MTAMAQIAMALHRSQLSASPVRRCNIPTAANIEGRAKACKANSEAAANAYLELEPMVAELRAEGLSHRQIARLLSASGFRTRKGSTFGQTQVKRILARLGQ